MRINPTFANLRSRTLLVFVLIASGATTALSVRHPAVAAAVVQAVQNAVTCGSTSACFLASNTSTGPGVAGTSAQGIGVQGKGPTGIKGIATTSYGVFGQSTSGMAGVAGTTASGDGVYGYTTGGGIGVSGSSSNGFGLFGTTSSGSGNGVVGTVNGNGTGVYGSSNSSYGLQGVSSSGYGLYASVTGTGSAAYLSASSGYGLIAYSNGSVAVYGRNSSGNGADLTGTYIGSVSRAPASNGFPIVATDANSNDVFYVDGVGNVSYHGGLFKFAYIRGGALVKSFAPNTTAPTMEDTGTAQLVGGVAAVPLNPTFAASIEAASSYRVFVTPNGDTHGLFVTRKTQNGFIVRESQGGRSTVSFDYRIVATALGQAGQQMTVANPATEPHAIAPVAPRLSSAPIAMPHR